jgi:hypothetical protein
LNHKGDEQVTIVLLSAEWLNGDAWEPCKAASGHKDSDYYYSIRNAPDTLLAIEPKSVEKLALRATIPISGHHYEHQRLLHSSFKTDVKVRFVITEANGKKATIVINVPKRPPFLRTREALAAEKPNVFLWASCDDTVAQMRLWVGVRLSFTFSARWLSIADFLILITHRDTKTRMESILSTNSHLPHKHSTATHFEAWPLQLPRKASQKFQSALSPGLWVSSPSLGYFWLIWVKSMLMASESP